MRSLKAIFAGSAFIVVVFLVIQLAYVFIAVGYNALASDFPVLKDISVLFRYIVGLPVLVVVMFLGGYITADIANIKSHLKVWLHCLIVGIMTAGAMMYSALENSNITLTGIVVVILALSASSAGGFYWLRESR